MGKYLQMLVAYSIFKEDLERVTDHFERFNREFEQVCEVFKEVTQQDFRPGQEVKKSTKPLAQVKPIPREPILTVRQYSLSDQEHVELKQFLKSYQLDEQLLQILLEEGASLADLFEMTEENMKEVGIKKFGQREKLLEAIREDQGGSNVLPVQLPEQHVEVKVVRLEQSLVQPASTDNWTYKQGVS